ncbi:alpha/beta hydrolase [Tardiphaga sp. P9-11]|uniref:alpha/beta fold hydrolase n=1 Tax=Tardiphaga sp. P9-11 TaxID=2024614 RepID=UPI0011F1F6CD|nr:alpha/beta hydrolase [Tardiphaga sp. P9-11]KAA0073968.1 alpha/beta hydrolase [Tardiphaga sp. P9-11]
MSQDLPTIGTVTTVDVDGLEVRTARGGSNVGAPILLTSPWPESIYAFRDVLPGLAEAGPFVALDLPGFGVSQGREDLMSPKAMASFIIKFTEQFGMTNMHAVGPDIGALALLFAAADRPDLFKSLVVGSGATSVELAAGGLVDLIASPRGAFRDAEGGDLGVGFVKGAAARPTPSPVMEDYRRSSAGTRFEEATNFVRAYNSELPELKTLLPTISTPVLVLAGRRDAVVPPANGQLLKDLLPHSKYVLLEGGHLIWEDAADEYASEIFDWVAHGHRDV